MIRHTLLINPLTRSLKCLFMANKGLNRFNHQPAVSMTTPPLVSPFTGQLPPQQQLQQQQAQAARDVNTASLCRIGQETVQDIVLRTMEIFQLLRNMQQLIPFMDDDGTKHDDHSAGQNRPTAEDRREIQEVNKGRRRAGADASYLQARSGKLKQKNQQLKQIMDQVRNLIWEINSMLAVRS
ncbi:mediator of RNA polymerase II transcription subunit 30 isoform X5 [Phyllopteryx taeniolatus]|uniref:mediator of RNA polymerase II transcription subunit 30 isoform X5 n=1 Tax=Phyllopteryx taeniolatus TaxID=161469 RepID=UPI002AD4B66E|nr:mediator of RNA polymerase II transcription subunit 30 isoform X5 [Phyllopteryx taeniolatus]